VHLPIQDSVSDQCSVRGAGLLELLLCASRTDPEWWPCSSVHTDDVDESQQGGLYGESLYRHNGTNSLWVHNRATPV